LTKTLYVRLVQIRPKQAGRTAEKGAISMKTLSLRRTSELRHDVSQWLTAGSAMETYFFETLVCITVQRCAHCRQVTS